jgi:hypothetical protein
MSTQNDRTVYMSEGLTFFNVAGVIITIGFTGLVLYLMFQTVTFLKVFSYKIHIILKYSFEA